VDGGQLHSLMGGAGLESGCPFASRHFAPVIGERCVRDLPRYFQTVRHAHTVPQAEGAALSDPFRIHRVPAYEARSDGSTRGRFAIYPGFKIDSSSNWVRQISYAQHRFSRCGPLQ
jgi:hypothetical protein